jgi:hypothetical protein
MELDALGKGPGGRRSSSMVETDKDVEAQQSAELFDLGRCCGILHGAACLPAVFLLLRVERRLFCRYVSLLVTETIQTTTHSEKRETLIVTY